MGRYPDFTLAEHSGSGFLSKMSPQFKSLVRSAVYGCLIVGLCLRVSAAEVEAVSKPAPREGSPLVRHNLLNERSRAAAGKIDLVFIGDSITQGWEGAGKTVWEKHYAGRKAHNLGIGGDKTQHVLWRLENGNLDGLEPKAAVVMIGTNNSGKDRNTTVEITEGVTAVISKLRAMRPQMKILLLGIFPRGQNFNEQRGSILQVNQAIARLADNQSVFWLDFGSQLINSDGSISKDLMPDYLHLSTRGYEIWADAIEPSLVALLGEKATAGATDPSGEWVWTINGPDGQPVSAPLILKKEGSKITGKFARNADSWLQIEEGSISGNAMKWRINRNRPDNGGTMTYEMAGSVEADGTIKGTAKTKLDGNEMATPWTAKRK